jgi:hypothetical protein
MEFRVVIEEHDQFFKCMSLLSAVMTDKRRVSDSDCSGFKLGDGWQMDYALEQLMCYA